MTGALALGGLWALSASTVFLHGCGDSPDADDITTTPELTTTSSAHEDSTTMTTTTTTTTTTTKPILWNCSTSQKTLEVVLPEQKGFALDDTTLSGCMDKVGIIPHSQEELPIKYLRMFTGWKPQFDESQRVGAWNKLKEYVEKTNAKILFGVEYNKGYEGWAWTLELMKLIGKEHVMGVGFGNEVDFDAGADFFATDGPLIQKIRASVAEMDAAGFGDVPFTTVFTAGVIASIYGETRPFLKQVYEEYGERYVWSFNPYSIWDAGLAHDASSGNCQGAVARATSMDYIMDMTRGVRDGIKDVTGTDDFKLWLTEAGWSSPGMGGQRAVNAACPEWGSTNALWTMYKNVMGWDLKFPDGSVAADFIFYFTLRDARYESFGLLSNCGAGDCKIQGDGALTDAVAAV